LYIVYEILHLIGLELQIITVLVASGMTVEITANKLCTGPPFYSIMTQTILANLTNQCAQ